MIDRCTIMAALCMMFVLFGVLACSPQVISIPDVENIEPTIISETVFTDPDIHKPSIYKDVQKPHLDRDTTEDHIEEVQTALFYATAPIGRYYITAYSHIETGSKITASGGKVHYGTITTCAADPKYHKFGEYLEVNGRIYRVEDTGSAVRKKHLDLYEPSMKKLDNYTGYQTVYRVEFPFGIPKDN